MELKKLFELAGVDTSKGKAKLLIEQHPEGPGNFDPQAADDVDEFAVGDRVRPETQSGYYPESPEEEEHLNGLVGQVVKVTGQGSKAVYVVKWNKVNPETGSEYSNEYHDTIEWDD